MGKEEALETYGAYTRDAIISSLGSCSGPKESVLPWMGVPACMAITALVKGCKNSATWFASFKDHPPSPVSHVHLVEGLLGQQGLHQGPGHGRVVCVVQCFCRDRGGGRGREGELQGSGVAALPSCLSFYLPLPECLSQPLTPTQFPGLQVFRFSAILCSEPVTMS